MTILSIRKLLVTTVLAVTASSARLVLDFDDISVPNDHSCGTSTLNINNTLYHNVAVTAGDFSASVLVLNTTKTNACSSSKDESRGLSPFNHETSSPNVAFSTNGGIIFQSIGPELHNNASFDISVVFTPQETTSSNTSILISTTTSDFNDIEEKDFTFHTASDGLGPYHVVVPSTNPYLFLEVHGFILTPDGKEVARVPSIFVDTVVLETVVLA